MAEGTPRWGTLQEIYGKALELPAAERPAYLDRACAGDAELRAEVESLLGVSGEASSSFERLAAELAAVPLPAGPLGPGAAIGPYEILAELGRGGMGVVYRARDRRLDRIVALKLLPPWLAGDPGARDRLVAEARAASAVDHPNVGILHDVTELADGSLCLVLAHYDGETLRDRLARGPLPVAEAVDAVRQAARGVAAVHARGIVHRDLKPANLMRTPDGRIVVLDFGVAKVAGGDLTGRGVRPGTVAYMSPEQVQGEPIDARSDVWALGVVLYESLAGRNPFARGSEAATLDAILHHEPPPLDAVRRDVPRRVARALRRALSKNPAVRPADAAALVRALEGRPRRGLRAVRPVLVGALALLVAVSPWLGHGPSPGGRVAPAAVAETARVAVLPFDVATGAELAYLREGIVNLLSVSLDGAGDMRSVDPYAVLARVEGDRAPGPAAAAAIARELGAGRFVLGSVVEVGGQLRIQASVYDAAGGPEPLARVSVEGPVERLFNLVDEMTAEILIAERRGPGEALTQVAGVTTGSLDAFKAYLAGERHYREGRFTAAIDAFGQAVEQDSLFALAWYRLGVAAGWLQRNDLSLSAAETAARLGERLPATERRILQANLAWPRGEPARAERLYREVLAERPESAEAWYGLGEVLIHMNPLRGRSFTEARVPFERALDLFGRDHAEPLIHLADLAAWEGRAADYAAYHARLHPEGDLALVYEAQRAHAIGSAADRARILAALEDAPSARIRHAAGRTASIGRSPAGGLAIARLLTRPGEPPETRGYGHLLSATMEAARGRWSRARVELDRAEPLIGRPALVQRAWLAAHPMLAVPAADRARVEAALEAWDPARDPVRTDPLLAFHQPLHPQLRVYLLGLLAARRGDAARVRGQAAALARLPEAPDRQEIGRDLALDLEARAAALTGRTGEALAILDSIRMPRRYDFVIRSPFYQMTLTRFLQAELLSEAGRPEDALRAYAAVPELYFDAIVFQGPSELRRAEILESLGRGDGAAVAYGRFIRVWRDADPEHQPAVERAERRRAALRGGRRN